MGKISLIELAAVLSKRYGVNKKDATGFVTQMFDIIQQSLEQDKLVKIKGLGTFKIIDVDDRESVNVNTGERVLIEGHPKITFVPDALMKELVNKPFSQFETVVLNDGVDFEDAIRNAISIGGDSDTIAAITGSIAEAAYGIPDWIKEKAYSFLDEPLKDVLRRWKIFVPHQFPG